jgi:hypothetical protein
MGGGPIDAVRKLQLMSEIVGLMRSAALAVSEVRPGGLAESCSRTEAARPSIAESYDESCFCFPCSAPAITSNAIATRLATAIAINGIRRLG